jgi:hypothetical protein
MMYATENLMEQAWYVQLMQCTLLRQKNHSGLLSLLGEELSSGALPCTPCGRSACEAVYDVAIRLLRTTGNAS